MILVLAAACGGDTGDAIVGDWTSEAMGDAVVTVSRDGGDFTIKLPNKTYVGQMEDDAVFAPFDDPTIVLEMKGDDLIMHFFKEEQRAASEAGRVAPATTRRRSVRPRRSPGSRRPQRPAAKRAAPPPGSRR